MTREYAAKRLLEHGPLTFSEFIEITGWTTRQVASVVYSMLDQGLIHHTSELGCRRRLYALS